MQQLKRFNMKVISLYQPYAQLAVTGHKGIETRPYNTLHRGPLLIHAAKAKSCENICADDPLWKHYYQLPVSEFIPPIKDLPYGAIVGMVKVIDTFIIGDELVRPESILKFGKQWRLNEKELAFGDYSTGRYGWLFADAVAFKTPIPAKGNQRFWNYDGPLPELEQYQQDMEECVGIVGV
jgi:activating signal cointegrator 1